MPIHILAPPGTFVSTSFDAHFLLIAASSGITPMLSILKSALAGGSEQVALINATRDESSVIFANALQQLSARRSSAVPGPLWRRPRLR